RGATFDPGGLADDVGVPVETKLPEPMAQDDERRSAFAIGTAVEEVSYERTYPERLEIITANQLGLRHSCTVGRHEAQGKERSCEQHAGRCRPTRHVAVLPQAEGPRGRRLGLVDCAHDEPLRVVER